MLTPRYRNATKADLRSSDTAPGSLRSRLIGSFLILGCGVFGLVFLLTQKIHAFDGRLGASLAAAGIVAGSLLALSVHSILGYHRDQNTIAKRSAEPACIEVFDVHASRVLDVQAPGSTGPALCFELAGGAQILLLRGQWLLEHSLYHARKPKDDGNDAHFNSLDAPHAFPSDRFTIHRWRGEVQPFWIQVRGEYLPPQNSPVQLRRSAGSATLKELEIFTGSIDSLQGDIDRAMAASPA